MFKKKQRHHNVPLSIGGRDKDCNKFDVDKDDHKLIHDTLDVPYNTVRKYRAVMNEGVFNPGEKQALAQSKIEKMFFSRVKFIPKNNLQKSILDKLREDTRDLYKTFNQPYPQHKATGSLQEEVEAELEKRKQLYIHLTGGQPLI